MPPKKDDEKAGKVGKGKAPPIEVDPALYRRQPVLPVELKDTPDPSISGYICNVDTLFPEWDVSVEEWSTPIENESEIVYPKCVQSETFKSLKSMLVAEVVDASAAAAGAKGAKKEPPKKGAAPVSQEFEELIRDVSDNLLPRM